MTASTQRDHYERIHDAYEAHYYDAGSLAFRREFVYGPLFAGLDLNGKEVADLAAGSGHNSLALREFFPDARTTGFDISPRACQAYGELTGRPCHPLDLTGGGAAGAGPFDAAMVFGGLHHCVSDLPASLATIHGMLKPGGLLLMWEPNRECWLEAVRRLWYRLDPYFEAGSEEALHHDEVAGLAAGRFETQWVRYGGGPAYFVIANSLVLRVPLALKRVLTGPLLATERLLAPRMGKALSPYFLARWRRI